MLVDKFDAISCLEYRYPNKNVAWYLSANGYLRYTLAMEIALVQALHEFNLCSAEDVLAVREACKLVTNDDVYAEEKRTNHDIKALVNRIRASLPDEVKSFVHLTATSYDIISSAYALMFRDVVMNLLCPQLKELLAVLIKIAEAEADTAQVGRTHLQHASPLTFGMSMAVYISRIGSCIEELEYRAGKLKGKFSGAVGAYNASSLIFPDPEAFEAVVLRHVGLEPAECSTQIAPLEPVARLFCEIILAAGVMADLACDMRTLQMTEISEVFEDFKDGEQVPSSAMPGKPGNPISFENAGGAWKVAMPRLMTVFMDQISQFQRDLTNSITGRTYGEIIAFVYIMTSRLTQAMSKIRINRAKMEQNIGLTGTVNSEAISTLLGKYGHPDAHTTVMRLAAQSRSEGKTLAEVTLSDTNLQPYLGQFSEQERALVEDPRRYIGIAPAKARRIAGLYRDKFDLR